MMIRVGWLLVGFLFGLVGTIMVAVLTVEHQQEEEDERKIKELDEQIRQEKEKAGQ